MTISVPIQEELVSTNVVDTTQSFDSSGDIIYPDNTKVTLNNNIYVTIGMPIIPEFNVFTNYALNSHVQYDGIVYKATTEYTAETSKGYLYANMWDAFTCPTFTQLTTQNVDFTVGNYKFRSRVVGTEPHTALVTKITYIPTSTSLGEWILSHMDDLSYPIDYHNDGYITMPPSNRWVFYSGVLYGIGGTIIPPTDYYNFTKGVIPESFLSFISADNITAPFDKKNYSYATATTTMTYTIKGLQKFDTLALGRCKADSVTIVFKTSAGVTVNTVTKTIDSSRDTSGNLEKWHTTVIYYATSTVEANGTVEVTLNGTNIELGTLMLGISVSAGFTKLELQNSFIDYSVYQEDEWGNIDYVPRAKIAVYKGSCDILITNYDMTDRLLTSLGGNLIILNGSDSKNTTPDSQSVFASTQKIGRLFDLSQQTKIKDNGMDNRATYSFTLKETV